MKTSFIHYLVEAKNYGLGRDIKTGPKADNIA